MFSKQLRTLIILTQILLLMLFPVGVVHAQDIPEAPSAPSAPESPSAPEPESVPEQPSQPDSPDAPEQPEAPNQPTAPEAPTPPSSTTPEPTPEAPSNTDSDATLEEESEGVKINNDTSAKESNETQNNSSSGDNVIRTGDITSSQSQTNIGNQNTSSGSTPSLAIGGATIQDNGAASDNSSLQTSASDRSTRQENSASVRSDLGSTADSGNNTVSYNLADNSVIQSGDVTQLGTIVNLANSNVDSVAVKEFAVNDNHIGDIIVDFDADQGCATACPNSSSSAIVQGNGAESVNQVTVVDTQAQNTFQKNDADVENVLALAGNTGNNQTSYNTGGDNYIQTGDVNLVGNVLNFLNTNIAGEVVVAVINLTGNVVGDVLLPTISAPVASSSTSSPSSQANVTGNGAESDNTVSTSTAHSKQTTQTNQATIGTEIVVESETGNNQATHNTGGDSYVETGHTNVSLAERTVANQNLHGGEDTWLVIVNEAGQWFGNVVGGNLPATAATDEASSSTLQVAENGAGSQQVVDNQVSQQQTITQANSANLQNRLHFSANTGGNQATYNTGGNSVIRTGDVNVLANVVNVVNTNVSGNGRLMVAVINVMGNWLGNVIQPGAERTNTAEKFQQAQHQREVGGQPSATPSPTSTPVSTPVMQVVEQQVTPVSQQRVMRQYQDSQYYPVRRRIVRRRVVSNRLVASTPQLNTPVVLGAETTVLGSPSPTPRQIASNAEPEKTRVNLAWGLLGLPMIGALGIRRIRR